MTQEILTLHNNHKRIWDWLSKNPGCSKWEWPEWDRNGGNIVLVNCYCFACEAAKLQPKTQWNVGQCRYCPIEWAGKRMMYGGWTRHCEALRSEYNNWKIAVGYENRTRLAEIIRDMPWQR